MRSFVFFLVGVIAVMAALLSPYVMVVWATAQRLQDLS